jgi:hypothetical protein
MRTSSAGEEQGMNMNKFLLSDKKKKQNITYV